MLPSRGYFHDIQCPDSACGRPYCHFGHKNRRKPIENLEESTNTQSTIPTYKPTPKSELEQRASHIPISYVPDLAFRPERVNRPAPKFENRPVYKPTPITLLSSINTSLSGHNDEQKEQIIDLQQNIASNEYDPLKSEINFEDLSSEFDQIDDILNEDAHSDDVLSENISKLNDDIKKEQDRLNLLLQSDPLSDEVKNEGTNLTIKKEVNEVDKVKTNSKNEGKESDRTSSNKKDKSNEKTSSNKQTTKKDNIECPNKSEKSSKSDKEKSSSKEKKGKTSSSKDKVNSKEKSGSSSSKSSDKHKSKSSPKEKSSKEKTEKHKSSDKEREKHRKEEKRECSSSKSKEEKPDKKNKSKNLSPEKKSRKDSVSSEASETERNKEKKKIKSDKERSDSSSRRKEKRTRSRSRSGSKTRKEEKRNKSKKSDKDKDRENKKRRRNSDSGNDDESTPKHTKSSSNNLKKEKIKLNKDKKKESNSKNRSKAKSSKDKRKSSESDFDNCHDNDMPMETDIVMSDVDLDLEDEDETMRECYRIFNEYAPIEEPSVPQIAKGGGAEFEQYEDSFSALAKKRVAHANAETSKPYNAPRPSECKTVAPTPGQILANRYRVARMAQANNEQESIMNEVRQMTAVKSAPSLLEAARLHKLKRLERERLKKEREKPKTNVVDDILNGAAKKPSVSGLKLLPKKINAVPNVALIEKAKERIAMVKRPPPEPVKTIAHTQKSGRVAHIPQVSLPDIPDVLQADKSKLPVNVRTRFLTLLAEECFKLYSSKPDAYDRALNEEFACYEKCKVLTTYRNSSMLAVNRLRKEIQERQSKNLGPLLSGESTQADKDSEFEGKRFHDNIKKWLLTEEELELHGYPRESGEKGKAVILNEKKEEDFSLVDQNLRRCFRCSRIYQVDDDGWPLFEDECMYHPLKKRTIRGQRVYLCCKSTEDTGCVTSESHVSEAVNSGALEGYQVTMPSERDNDPRSSAVYALDCEMCYTTQGLELTRLTIVDTECKIVYESFVKPLNPIIDYNTRFSGITKEHMDRAGTNILQVQANILHLCNSDTILVGHSLESDMKALKIVHSSIIDTAVLFPHKMGLPHKRALRSLASEYLRKIIQNDVGGHDSAEDAVTCMELLRWKLREELKLPGK